MNPWLFYTVIATKAIALILGGLTFTLALFTLVSLINPNGFCGEVIGGKHRSVDWLVGWICSFLLFAVWFGSITKIKSRTFLASKEGEIIRVFEKSTTMWTWNYLKLTEKGEWLDFRPLTKQTEIAINPITENPKVRNIRIWLAVTRLGKPESVLRCRAALQILPSNPNTERNFSDFVKFQLYEFCERESKTLSKFYNPIDFGQQDHFQQFLRGSLDSTFEQAGLQIDKAQFSIPEY